MGDKTVVLIGTLDTKGDEYAFLRQRLELHGVRTLLIDVGTGGRPRIEPDIDRHGVVAALDLDPSIVEAATDRGQAVSLMADAAAVLAAGDTRAHVGASDVTSMASVTDIAGVNFISARILANAAAAIAGMVNAPDVELPERRRLIGATMFGVTTQCVTTAREAREETGYEVLVWKQSDSVRHNSVSFGRVTETARPGRTCVTMAANGHPAPAIKGVVRKVDGLIEGIRTESTCARDRRVSGRRMGARRSLCRPSVAEDAVRQLC